MEIGPPSGDRGWEDVEQLMESHPEAKLSRAGATSLLRTYLRLVREIRALADDPRSTRVQLRQLVPPNLRAERLKREATAMRARQEAQRAADAARTREWQREARLRDQYRTPRGARVVTDDEIRNRYDLMTVLRAVAAGQIYDVPARQQDAWTQPTRYQMDGKAADVTLLRLLREYGCVRMPDGRGPQVTERGRIVLGE